jgi:hypothetical protein
VGGLTQAAIIGVVVALWLLLEGLPPDLATDMVHRAHVPCSRTILCLNRIPRLQQGGGTVDKALEVEPSLGVYVRNLFVGQPIWRS